MLRAGSAYGFKSYQHKDAKSAKGRKEVSGRSGSAAMKHALRLTPHRAKSVPTGY